MDAEMKGHRLDAGICHLGLRRKTCRAYNSGYKYTLEFSETQENLNG